MKLIKKILGLGATLCLLLGFSVAAISCADTQGTGTSDSSGSELVEEENNDNAEYVYRVSLQNETGFGFSGATVKLMNGTTEVAVKKTNSSGNANFLAEDIQTPGEYTIVIEGAPEGYSMPTEPLTTSKNAGTQTVVAIKPTGLLAGEAPQGAVYNPGSVMHDFSVVLSNGSVYKLSEVLAEKKLVMLNFWASWCGYCKSEFIPMDTAMVNYNDRVSVLALTIERGDSDAYVSNYKSEEGLKYFDMGKANHPIFGTDSDPYAYAKTFPEYDETGALNTSVPHTVLIDRYGVVVYNHIGALQSASDFTSLFDRFVGDDYTSTVLSSAVEGSDEENGDENSNRAEPNVPAPAISDLKAAFAEGSASGISFRFQSEDVSPDEEGYDKYNWPWIIGEDNDYISPSNATQNNSYAILYASMTANGGDTLAFDYKIKTEDTDILYVLLDGQIIKTHSGNNGDEWHTSYSYVFKDYEQGKHELAFIFMKDYDGTMYEDIVQLRNLRILSASSLDGSTEDINIFRNAAALKNTATDAATQFVHYVNFVEPGAANEGKSGDQYYHVRNADGTVGPILFANILNPSQWNEYDLWTLAYSNYVVGDGMNFAQPIENFAWEANQSTSVHGYTPVTSDLYYLLDKAVKYTTFGQKFKGDYHNREWLELCVYWEHYGTKPLPSDPMAGVTFAGAKPLDSGVNGSHKNTVDVPFALNPRGFKYYFTPQTSGVYKVYSEGDKEPNVFLFAPDRKTQLGFWESKMVVLTDANKDDPALLKENDFEFYWYFEADVTYYLLFTIHTDYEMVNPVSYDVYLDYLGDEHTYLTNAATEVYSVNPTTFELFIPDAIEYAYSEADGYYHHVKKDGSLGSVIYLDVMRTTAFEPDNSLYGICQADALKDKVLRELYVDGVDYSVILKPICEDAIYNVSGAMQGYVPVTQELFEILQTITIKGSAEGIEETWLQLCYYYKTISATENDNI